MENRFKKGDFVWSVKSVVTENFFEFKVDFQLLYARVENIIENEGKYTYRLFEANENTKEIIANEYQGLYEIEEKYITPNKDLAYIILNQVAIEKKLSGQKAENTRIANKIFNFVKNLFSGDEQNEN